MIVLIISIRILLEVGDEQKYFWQHFIDNGAVWALKSTRINGRTDEWILFLYKFDYFQWVMKNWSGCKSDFIRLYWM